MALTALATCADAVAGDIIISTTSSGRTTLLPDQRGGVALLTLDPVTLAGRTFNSASGNEFLDYEVSGAAIGISGLFSERLSRRVDYSATAIGDTQSTKLNFLQIGDAGLYQFLWPRSTNAYGASTAIFSSYTQCFQLECIVPGGTTKASWPPKEGDVLSVSMAPSDPFRFGLAQRLPGVLVPPLQGFPDFQRFVLVPANIQFQVDYEFRETYKLFTVTPEISSNLKILSTLSLAGGLGVASFEAALLAPTNPASAVAIGAFALYTALSSRPGPSQESFSNIADVADRLSEVFDKVPTTLPEEWPKFFSSGTLFSMSEAFSRLAADPPDFDFDQSVLGFEVSESSPGIRNAQMLHASVVALERYQGAAMSAAYQSASDRARESRELEVEAFRSLGATGRDLKADLTTLRAALGTDESIIRNGIISALEGLSFDNLSASDAEIFDLMGTKYGVSAAEVFSNGLQFLRDENLGFVTQAQADEIARLYQSTSSAWVPTLANLIPISDSGVTTPNNPVPEPSTALLAALGLVAAAASARRTRGFRLSSRPCKIRLHQAVASA